MIEQNEAEHIERHKMLHGYLDELLADFMQKTGKFLSKASCMELMQWSYKQTKKPDTENKPLSWATDENFEK